LIPTTAARLGGRLGGGPGMPDGRRSGV